MSSRGDSSFDSLLAGNLVWAFLASGSAKILSLASAMVLARLLAPEAFGLMGFGLVVATYLDSIADLGTGAALIYWPDRRREAAQLAFVANLASGLCLLGAARSLAPFVATFFRHPEATPILRALAFSFPLRSLGATHDALLRKDMRFRTRAAPEIAQTLARTGVSVALAASGLGVWSLVWGQLAGVCLWTLVQWNVVDFRPDGSFPRELVGPFARYGAGIVSVNVLAAVVHHFDLVVVGRALGAGSLGLYQMAQKLPEATIAVAVWTTSIVLFPAFSRAQKDESALRDAYLGAFRYVSLLVVPTALGLSLLAEPLVILAYGERWRESAPILSALALAVGIRAIGTHAGDVLKATGRPGLLATIGLLKAALVVPALVAVSPLGATSVAATLAAVNAATFFLNIAVASRLVAVSAGQVVEALRPVFVSSCLFAATLLSFRSFGPLVSLALAVPVYVGTALYLLPGLYPRLLVAGSFGSAK